MSEEDDIRIMAAADALALELGVRRVTVEKLRNRAGGKTSSVNLGLPAFLRNTHTRHCPQNRYFFMFRVRKTRIDFPRVRPPCERRNGTDNCHYRT